MNPPPVVSAIRYAFITCPSCFGRGTVAMDTFGPSGVNERDIECGRCFGACNITVERKAA